MACSKVFRVPKHIKKIPSGLKKGSFLYMFLEFTGYYALEGVEACYFVASYFAVCQLIFS